MVWCLFCVPVNFLTSVKFLNWVCSRCLAVAFSSLPSGSEEFLNIRATVAMAFSSSEPFPRAVREEIHSDEAEVGNNLSPDVGLHLLRELSRAGLEGVCQRGPVLGLFAPHWTWDVGVSCPGPLNSGEHKFFQDQLELIELG